MTEAPAASTTGSREAGAVTIAGAVEVAAIGTALQECPAIHVRHDKVGT
jgi:hypothetical protein